MARNGLSFNKMREYFIVATTKAAPIVSDIVKEYRTSDDVNQMLNQYISDFRHIAGLYAVNVYRSADDFEKGSAPIAYWRSELCLKSLYKS